MFSNQHLTRGLLLIAVTFVAGAGFVPAAQAQSDVTLRVVSQEFVFEADTMLEVDVEVTGAVALAGLDFVLSYPEELVPETAEATLTGDLWQTVIVNYDRNDAQYTPPAGRRYVAAAAANATNVESTDGRVLTLSFPVACQGNAQGHPDGRQVAIEVVAVNASTLVPDQNGDGFDDLATVISSGENGNIILNCTTVSGDTQSFGTLKSVYGLPSDVR